MVKKLPILLLFIAALSFGQKKDSDSNQGKSQSSLSTSLNKNDPKNSDKESLGLSSFKQAQQEIKRQETNKALLSYQNAFNHLKQAGSPKIIGVSGDYIDLLNKQKQFEKALKIIADVETLNEFENAGYKDQLLYQNAIADTYKATKNTKEAIKAYQSAITIMDSISSVEKSIAVDKIQAEFHTELQREKNLALEANNKALQKDMQTEKMLLLLYIVISISIIILILLFLRSYWLKNRLQKEELKSIEIEKDLIQKQHEHEQELNHTQKEIIEEKQRELTSAALRMANYQDSINGIIEKCNASQFIRVNDVKKELQHLMKQKDYWKQFETRFNNLHPEFGNTLTNKFSKLTKNDIEFCSLLKLNLSNKEIASLLQISHESAITKKYRIKKKMEINDDAEFEKLLMEI